MSKVRYEALDGWRGIAALAIAFYHAPIAHPLREGAAWKNWELFVDFFFVLSGFVIAHAWLKRLDGTEAAKSFLSRRFWRVWPLHVTILGGFVALEFVKILAGLWVTLPTDVAPFEGSRSGQALLTNLFLIQSFNLHGTTTWNGPAWSISVEFWTYAVFALAVLLVPKRTGLAFFALAILGAAGIALYSPIGLFATHDYGFLRALFGFFVGALTQRLMARSTGNVMPGTSVELAAVGCLAAYLLSTGTNATSLLAPLVFAMIVVLFAHGGGQVSRLLLSRPVQALGLWSYSVYLVHTLIYYVFRVGMVGAEKVLRIDLTASGSGSERVFTFGHGALDALALLALLGLSVAISAFTYRFIEKPFMAPASPPPQDERFPVRLSRITTA